MKSVKNQVQTRIKKEVIAEIYGKLWYEIEDHVYFHIWIEDNQRIKDAIMINMWNQVYEFSC